MEPPHVEMERMRRELSRVRQQLAELGAVLASRRIHRISADGFVHVEVDVHGDLLRLEVDPKALRGHHVRGLGRSLVETINAARHAGEVAQTEAASEIFHESRVEKGPFHVD